MARSNTPELGSRALHVPSTSQVVQVTPSTCHNLSVFKDIMREHRKLDDSVTMRLNRNQALFRDREREAAAGTTAAAQDEACAYFWSQLVSGWKARTQIIQYCVDVVDAGMEQTKATFEKDSETAVGDAAVERRQRSVLYAEQVKKNQLHNELTVEQIVRTRSIEAFRSRCKYFEPPLTDVDARKWWDAAVAGKKQ
ncbi:hypothetical protein M422DRAFT_57550 [Sphaerobolus stellatus SS14]|nr:hypothetical protein M422DRAFT_57550 [Sphaerobolus stellatus SS14]